MKKCTKIWMIVSLSLLIAGLIVAIVGGCLMKFDFWSLDTTKTSEKTYEITEEFQNISISENTANVIFLPSDDESVKVVCHDQKKMTHSVTVENGVLTVKLIDSRKWYDHIKLFSFKTPKTTVYLPKGDYETLTVKTNTGDIQMPDGYTFESASLFVNTGDISWQADVTGACLLDTNTGDVKISNANLGSLKLETSTGDVTLQNVNAGGSLEIETDMGDQSFANVLCASLKTEVDTGDITLTDTIASGDFTIETDTGDVKFVRADAANLNVKTDTGDVKGSLRSEKIFFAKSSTGKENVPETLTGGKCTIKSSTGNIRITIEK